MSMPYSRMLPDTFLPEQNFKVWPLVRPVTRKVKNFKHWNSQRVWMSWWKNLVLSMDGTFWWIFGVAHVVFSSFLGCLRNHFPILEKWASLDKPRDFRFCFVASQSFRTLFRLNFLCKCICRYIFRFLASAGFWHLRFVQIGVFCGGKKSFRQSDDFSKSHRNR